MKNMEKQICILVATVLILEIFAGCARRPEPATPPALTNPTATSLPQETTVPVTTVAPSVEYKVTYKMLCDMIDEAEAYLLSNQTVSVPINFYTQTYVDKMNLMRRGYVFEKDGYYTFEDQIDENIHKRLFYLYFLSNVIAQYGDDIIWTDYKKGTDYQGFITYSALLVVGYEGYGYETAKEYFDSGRHLEDNMIEYTISFEGLLVNMDFRDGEYQLVYPVYRNTPTIPTLYNGLATEPWLVKPSGTEYTGNKTPPC